MLSMRVLSSLLILSAVAPSTVQAQAAPESLAVHVDVCSQNLVDRRALQIELSTLGVEVIEDAAVVHLYVRCTSTDGVLEATFTNPATRRFIERPIRVPASDRSRNREIAIHLVEMLRAVWPELTVSQELEQIRGLERRVEELQSAQEHADAAMVERSEEERAQAVARETSIAQEATREIAALDERVRALESEVDFRSTFVFGRASVVSFGGLLLAGADVGVERRLGPLRLVVGASVLAGRTTHELGDVRLRTFSGSLALMLPVQAGPVLFSIGPRIRVGLATATGLPDDVTRARGSSTRGVFVSAELTSAVWLWASPSWRVGFDVAVSYTLGGVDAAAADSRIARTQGPGLGGGLAAALAF